MSCWFKSWVWVVLGMGTGVLGQGVGDPRRPLERPSRAVEELLEKRAAAGAGAEKTEDGTSGVAEPLGGGGRPAVPEEPLPAEAVSVFRVAGAEVWEAARRAGWKFFPMGAVGARDGRMTVAEIQPGLIISSVDGPVLRQRGTPAGWGVVSENTFYLFTDAHGRARELAPGWTVREVRLSGAAFRWLTRPRAGGSSPSLAVRVAGARGGRDSVVRLEGVVLVGPRGARDWKQAFGSGKGEGVRPGGRTGSG